jgi:curved DNA-binding protein CbpA
MPSPSCPSPRDPHDLLGVPRDATPAEITAAYRALVRVLHPDTRRGPADPARFAEVLAAYELLRDPRGRAADEDRRPFADPPPASAKIPIPVRVHPHSPLRRPDIRVGPVRRHPY